MTFKRKIKRRIKDIPSEALPTKVKRRKPKLTEQIQILVRQATCALSGEPLVNIKNVEWDHILEVGLGGANTVENWQAVLKNPHRKKTSGTKATSVGSSTHKVAHVKQLIAKRIDHTEAMTAKNIGSKSHAKWLEEMAKQGKHVVPRRGV